MAPQAPDLKSVALPCRHPAMRGAWHRHCSAERGPHRGFPGRFFLCAGGAGADWSVHPRRGRPAPREVGLKIRRPLPAPSRWPASCRREGFQPAMRGAVLERMLLATLGHPPGATGAGLPFDRLRTSPSPYPAAIPPCGVPSTGIAGPARRSGCVTSAPQWFSFPHQIKR
jgi:hypothetical protein